MQVHVEFDVWAQRLREHFESVADRALPQADSNLGRLAEAMRYAVLGGGKRVRALFVYAAGALTMAHPERLDAAALAVEFVHAYSLVHDDMPCMDNDTLRRGKPTVHVKYGEALAMLAGDALQPAAFELICGMDADCARKNAVVAELARASGFWGMCGGQAIDLLSVGCKIDIADLRRMHAMKTGALIGASVRMGALCGEVALYDAVAEHLDAYAQALGLGFQVVDDILDVTADSSTLGKTAGKDAASDKPTYVSLLGLEEAEKLAAQCMQQALSALSAIEAASAVEPAATQRLADMAHYVIGRKF